MQYGDSGRDGRTTHTIYHEVTIGESRPIGIYCHVVVGLGNNSAESVSGLDAPSYQANTRLEEGNMVLNNRLDVCRDWEYTGTALRVLADQCELGYLFENVWTQVLDKGETGRCDILGIR